MRQIPRVVLILSSALGTALSGVGQAQDSKGVETVDRAKVERAIQAGVEYLKKTPTPGAHHEMANTDELLLLTLLEARVPDNDPLVQKLLSAMLQAPLERTYKVVLQAMVLEDFDRVKYQDRIWQCAQFLVDNQCQNGQWAYGEPTQSVKNIPTVVVKKSVATGGPKALTPPVTPEVLAAMARGERIKPKVAKNMPVDKTRDGPAGGDNSNSQYAALGLRACHDAGIKIPEKVITLARKWWYDTQHPSGDEGKKKEGSPTAKPAVASGRGEAPLPPALPRGWCYGDVYGVCKGGPEYAGMTAGAIGAIGIYEYILGKDWKRNEHIHSGIAWLAGNWSVTENRGPSEVEGGAGNAYLYYYLYALERLGMLLDLGEIGGHAWYPEGAQVLLSAQQPDGSWKASRPEIPVWDTCFAILFLKRATRGLVASESSGSGNESRRRNP
jgi:hypothetical protein